MAAEGPGGGGVIDNAQATLAFPEAEKVSGNGSCNRFFGPVKIEGDLIQVGPLGSTRMACPQAVMHQETKYLNALQAAERFEWQDPICCCIARAWKSRCASHERDRKSKASLVSAVGIEPTT